MFVKGKTICVFRYREQYDLLHRCVLVRNSKYGVVAENNDELEYY